MSVTAFFEIVAITFEVIGVGVMALGFVVALGSRIRTWVVSRDGRTAFTTLRDSFGLVILLGLEVLVAADLVRTVTSTPSLTNALVLAIIVLIRTVLSFSLQIEIEGVAPWKRALLTSPQLIARAVRTLDGTRRQNEIMTDSRLAVIVLAAGQGTRMKSVRPKVLHPLAGVPLIGHVLATARELSAAHVVTVVRHERDSVAAAILELMPEAIVVDQDEMPGTGRAVEIGLGALPDDFDGDVVVVSGDVPLLDAATLTGLLAAHRQAAAAATLLSAIVDDATGYGRIVRDDDGCAEPHRRAEGRRRRRAADHRDQLRHLRVRGRRPAHPAAARRLEQRAGREVPHRRRRPAARRRAAGGRRPGTRARGSSRASTIASSSRARRRASTR